MIIQTLKQIFHRISIVFSNQLAILIAIPFITSKLGIDHFGLIGIGMILTQIIWVLSDWGFGFHSIEFFSTNKSSSNRNEYFTSILIIKLFMIVSFSLVSFLFIKMGWIKLTELNLFFALLISFFFGGMNPLIFFQALKRPEFLVKPTLYSRVLYLFLIFYFVDGIESSYWVFLAQGITMAIISSYGFWILFKHFKFKLALPRRKFLKEQVTKSTPFFINIIVNEHFSSFWALALIMVGSPIQIAIFSLAEQVLRAGGAISNIISHTLRANFIDQPLSKIKRLIIGFTLFYFLTMIIGIALIPFVISKILDSEYAISSIVIQMIIVVWAISSINKLITYPITARIYGSVWVNKITYIFWILHGIGIFLWLYLESTSALSMTFFIQTVLLIECIILCYVILKRPS